MMKFEGLGDSISRLVIELEAAIVERERHERRVYELKAQFDKIIAEIDKMNEDEPKLKPNTPGRY